LISPTIMKSLGVIFNRLTKHSLALAMFFGSKVKEENKYTNSESTHIIAAGYCLNKKARTLQNVQPNSKGINNSYDCGEDAFFVDVENGSFGVADGVGSWSTKGVDPGEIARKLMSNSRDAIAHGEKDPLNALDSAYSTIINKKQVSAGSSTACILHISNGKLNTANLGDSGFIILRPLKSDSCNYDIIYKSVEQQLYFNCPKQLSVIPPNTPNAMNFVQNSPKEADKEQFDVFDGDLVIAATDGLFDNLYNHDILQVVSLTCKEMQGKQNYEVELARRLVLKARKVATDHTAMFTPFSDNAYRNGMYHRGGKPDDITCVVARVVVNSNGINRSKL
jgi:protein phosphatase PTC7